MSKIEIWRKTPNGESPVQVCYGGTIEEILVEPTATEKPPEMKHEITCEIRANPIKRLWVKRQLKKLMNG